MKRLIIFLALSFANGTVAAEWIFVGATEKADFYADLETIVKAGAKAKMWSMLDLAEGELYGNRIFFSAKDYQEYDCKERTSRLISTIRHSGRMGQGDVVLSYTFKPADQTVTPVVPGAAGTKLWQAACGKK